MNRSAFILIDRDLFKFNGILIMESITRKILIPGGVTVTIKTKPWWLFWLLNGYTITLYPNIYTPRDNFTPNNASFLFYTAVHENVHLNQQKALGKWKFYWAYLTSKKFRYAMELEAYSTQYKQEKSDGRNPNYMFAVDALSGFPYFWCVDRKTAIDDFRKALG